MRVKEKESIFKGIIFALLCTSSSYAALSEQMTLNKFFENIVLIINFNHPYYGNIEFIKKLYSPLFDEIAFYGEEAHPDVFNCSTKNGYLLSNVIEDALMRFPNQSGYLFLQDDCILNFWNYLSLDKEKIWYAIAFNDGKVSNNFFYDIRNFNGQSYGKNWGGWDMPCAMSAAIIAFSHLQAGDCFMLHDNLGVNNVPIQMCEVFYIPQRFKN
ncbi:MAG TPA: hypothetical protein VFF04_05305, partial [Candidatus Babeliales bacterium]|nr:hypothetical protein [Candidatus Babeliales bacterium]